MSTTRPLPTTREALCAACDRGETFEYVFFWGHRPAADGSLGPSVFSQWWPAVFAVGGVQYGSAEQYMMAEKARLFGDSDALERILAARQPGAQKALGRNVAGFDEARWAEARFEIVLRGSLAKFASSERLRNFLTSTGQQVLVEASPLDPVWGIGLQRDDPRARDPRKWRGDNLLGFALMLARSELSSPLP